MKNNMTPIQYSASVMDCLALLAREEQCSAIPGTSGAKACFEVPGVFLHQCCRDVLHGLALVAALLGGGLGSQSGHPAFLPERLFTVSLELLMSVSQRLPIC